MNLFYSILVGIAVIIAIAFTALVLITGKGDAMSGGSGVRTTFKGMASFDDIMSKWTLYIGVAFMALVLIIDVVGKRLDAAPASLSTGEAGANIERNVQITPPPANLPATPPIAGNPSPAGGTPPPPATNSGATNPGATNPEAANPEAANPPMNSAPATTVPSVVPTPAPGTSGGR